MNDPSWMSELKRLEFTVASLASLFESGSFKKEIAETMVLGVRVKIDSILNAAKQDLELAKRK